jgi:hypothetical protein
VPAFAILRDVVVKALRGLTLLDVIVVLALVGLLAWLVRLDRRPSPPTAAPVPAAARVPG